MIETASAEPKYVRSYPLVESATSRSRDSTRTPFRLEPLVTGAIEHGQ